MAFQLSDVRIQNIILYIAELTARATAMPPLLPGQNRAIDSSVAELLFDAVKELAIENELEISNTYFTPAIQKAFERRVAQVINTLNNPANSIDHTILANELFVFAKQLDLNSQSDNQARFASQSARGLTYVQKLRARRAHNEMLDSEAVSALLECAKLPSTVGHVEVVRNNGRPLEQHDLDAIQNELTGYTEAGLGLTPVVVAPKQYVIVSLAQNNAHWYGNIYQLGNGKAQPIFKRDFDYAMGNNTCGISAVARSLQEIGRLIPGYHSNLPAPTARAQDLSKAANKLLLARTVPAAQHPVINNSAAVITPAPVKSVSSSAKTKASKAVISDNKTQKKAIKEQVKRLAFFSEKAIAEGKTVSKDVSNDWSMAYTRPENSALKAQYDIDRKLAIQLAIEEVESQTQRLNKK